MTYGHRAWSQRRRLWRTDHRATPAAARDTAGYPPVDVAIVCESTYPYLTGGLSAVVHQICEANPDSRIGIVHIAWDHSSPQIPLYDVPPQVRWVKVVYQSLAEHAGTFQRFSPRDIRLPPADQRELARRVIHAVDEHMRGSDHLLWELYDEGINPLTRRYRLWPVISTQELMRSATAYFAGSGLTFTQIFWHLREFFSLTYAVTDLVLPEAGIYHAHTTGAAAILAACGARQHSTKFLLTEHNLYTRDTINHLLDRSMDTPITLDEWRTLDDYVTSSSPPRPARVDPDKRAWMAWWARTGLFAYRAADRITYLYPEAIEEARGLGGLPEKSSVLPNGVTPSHFDEARDVFRRRQEHARTEGASGRIWKLAYAARVVPIKGLLDLLEALATLAERGVTSWELDVMGPDGEMPHYAALCRRRCTELGLDRHVKFLGSVNLRERFGHYDVLILPSHNEGQPIVVLEAMTMGLPTIGTYVGGMKQLVEDPVIIEGEGGTSREIGSCGELVRSHDVDAMAGAIQSLIGPASRFEEFSANAVLRVEHYFHVETAMAYYRQLYASMLREQRPTKPIPATLDGQAPIEMPPWPQSPTGREPSQLTPADQDVDDARRMA
jgi:glycosyltransferase involved in cell wall biosynthesis